MTGKACWDATEMMADLDSQGQPLRKVCGVTEDPQEENTCSPTSGPKVWGGWLVSWLVDRLVGWLVGWSFGWSAGQSVGFKCDFLAPKPPGSRELNSPRGTRCHTLSGSERSQYGLKEDYGKSKITPMSVTLIGFLPATEGASLLRVNKYVVFN